MDSPKRSQIDESLARQQREERIKGIDTVPSAEQVLPSWTAAFGVFASDGTVDYWSVGDPAAFEPGSNWVYLVTLAGDGSGDLTLQLFGMDPGTIYDHWAGPSNTTTTFGVSNGGGVGAVLDTSGISMAGIEVRIFGLRIQ